MIVLGLILLAVSAAAGFCLWTRPAAGWLARAPWWLVVLVPAAPLAVAAAVAAAAGAVDDTVSPLLAYPLAVVAAVAGGNPSSRTILAAARRTDSAPPAGYAVPIPRRRPATPYHNRATRPPRLATPDRRAFFGVAPGSARWNGSRSVRPCSPARPKGWPSSWR